VRLDCNAYIIYSVNCSINLFYAHGYSSWARRDSWTSRSVFIFYRSQVNNTHSIISGHYHRNCALFTYLCPRDSINYCDTNNPSSLCAPLGASSLWLHLAISRLSNYKCAVSLLYCCAHWSHWFFLCSLGKSVRCKRERGAPKINIKVEKRNQNL